MIQVPAPRRAKRTAKPMVKLVVQTQTDVTGHVRGWLYGPKLNELRTVDGSNRAEVARRLAVYGCFWLRVFGLSGQVVDGGDL